MAGVSAPLRFSTRGLPDHARGPAIRALRERDLLPVEPLPHAAAAVELLKSAPARRVADVSAACRRAPDRRPAGWVPTWPSRRYRTTAACATAWSVWSASLFAVYQAIHTLIGAAVDATGIPPEKISFPHALAAATDSVTAGFPPSGS